MLTANLNKNHIFVDEVQIENHPKAFIYFGRSAHERMRISVCAINNEDRENEDSLILDFSFSSL